jgi:hypothetical protein
VAFDRGCRLSGPYSEAIGVLSTTHCVELTIHDVSIPDPGVPHLVVPANALSNYAVRGVLFAVVVTDMAITGVYIAITAAIVLLAPFP